MRNKTDQSVDSKPARIAQDASLFPEYEIFGQAPVQALGDIADREFYFRARHTEWSFEVTNATGEFPTDGFSGGFLREGKYRNASYMPESEARAIIDRCAKEYLAEIRSGV